MIMAKWRNDNINNGEEEIMKNDNNDNNDINNNENEQ